MNNMEYFREPRTFSQLQEFQTGMPVTISHIHILITEIQKRQYVLRLICMRCKESYRQHLDQIVEIDTVGKATLSDRTYQLILANEMRRKAATEAFMENAHQEGEALAAWKVKLVALEHSMWRYEH